MPELSFWQAIIVSMHLMVLGASRLRETMVLLNVDLMVSMHLMVLGASRL